MKPQPEKRYSKTDLRRGAIARILSPTHAKPVAADEQAALFGEAPEQEGASPSDPGHQRPSPSPSHD